MMTEHSKEVTCFKLNTVHLRWSAIFAGAFVGIGLVFLLNIFGLAIGLSAYSAGANGSTTLAVGGLIGVAIGVIASMGSAGYVTGYLSRFQHCFCHHGVIYGFLTWAMGLILAALLFIPLSFYVTFYQDTLSPNPLGVSSAIGSGNTVSTPATANEQIVAPGSETAKNLAYSGWILFGLFFLGAFSSCIGACGALRCNERDHVHHHETVIPPRE